MSSQSRFNQLSFRHIGTDFTGGLTAAVVALPLALAFGMASGAGPVAGVYGAVLVGFFAALFGGTPSQVSGPTGPMTVVMAGVFTSMQAKYPETGLYLGFTAVIIAGLFQIAFGLLRLGKYFILVPYPVISGFMTGIGVIIIILQLGPLLGHGGTPSLMAALVSLPDWLLAINWQELALGGLALAVVYLWPARWNVWLPRPLVALLTGTLVALWFPPEAIAIIGDIPTGFPPLHWPVINLDVLGELLYAGVLLAVLGSIDSLLTSLVADSMTKQQHDSDRELIGQGVGNTLAGFFGGLPGAGATMRTVVNIRAGGKTGFSGAIHALVLLVVMMGAGKYAAHVPLAVLAGILIKVGLDIIDWPFFRRLGKLPMNTVALMLLVLGLTVFVDLITAVLVGVFLSNLITVERLTSIQLDSVHLTDGTNASEQGRPTEELWLESQQGALLMLRLKGPLSFGVGRGLRRRLSSQMSHQTMIFDLTGALLVGTSTAMILDELIQTEMANGRDVLVVGLSEKTEQSLARLGTLDTLGRDRIFPSFEDMMSYVDSRPGLTAGR
ncbi:SulP family inorganic anion transporter [Porticoccus litoralis]|uniref:SulP family inorganic anion transporter n=1 Tax=Porticoccus litoralis TaxID=434086 RepID=A0AAW8B5M2_9GAMM|nr:SulP family inorganic anion transporter [Porticoccus litoralis]MDP1521221.1 SulP family inorganic anion transporter [Porticoccus litoralis]